MKNEIIYQNNHKKIDFCKAKEREMVAVYTNCYQSVVTLIFTDNNSIQLKYVQVPFNLKTTTKEKKKCVKPICVIECGGKNTM